MIRQTKTRIGEGLLNIGDSLVQDADAYRVEYGNPKEVPERNIYDALGERFQKIGQKLLDIETREK